MGYKAKNGYTFWEKDFDGMAYKTMLRQLISKWGIMSIDMQTAQERDMAVITETGFEYIDNGEMPDAEPVVPLAEPEPEPAADPVNDDFYDEVK